MGWIILNFLSHKSNFHYKCGCETVRFLFSEQIADMWIYIVKHVRCLMWDGWLRGIFFVPNQNGKMQGLLGTLYMCPCGYHCSCLLDSLPMTTEVTIVGISPTLVVGEG